MSKEFYNKVCNDLKALESRVASTEPITQEELSKFKQEAINMLQIVNGTAEYEAVKMSSHNGFKSTKHEILLNAIINKINTLQTK